MDQDQEQTQLSEFELAEFTDSNTDIDTNVPSNATTTVNYAYSPISTYKHEHLTEHQLKNLNLLISIIRDGSYDEFLQLLHARGFKNLLNVFIDGQTPLHYTLIYGRSLPWCEQLVSNGANPNLTNQAGWHPIHLAAYSNSRETMRYLIEKLND